MSAGDASPATKNVLTGLPRPMGLTGRIFPGRISLGA